MNYFDIFFAIICLYFVIRGAMRGFVGEIISLVSFAVAYYIAPVLCVPIGEKLAAAMGISIYIAEVAAVVLVWVTIMLLSAIVRMIVTRIVGVIHLGALNRMLGVFSGIAKAVLLLYVVIMCGLLTRPVISPVWLSKSDAISYAGRYWPSFRAFAIAVGVLPEDTDLPDGTLNQILRPYRTGSEGPNQ